MMLACVARDALTATILAHPCANGSFGLCVRELVPASPRATRSMLAGMALAALSLAPTSAPSNIALAPTSAPSNIGDTWVPTLSPTCMPEIVTYAAASQDGFLAWLNHALSGLCLHTLQVMLSSGKVPLGNAQLDALPPGLHLILQGSGRSGAGATTLDFDRDFPVELRGTDVRIEFSNINFVSAVPPSAGPGPGPGTCPAPRLGSARLLPSPCSLLPYCGSHISLFATVGARK